MLNNILGGLFGKVVDNAEGILDKVITTDKERLQAKKELKDLLINAEKSAQEQVTRRWEADAKINTNLFDRNVCCDVDV